MTLSEAIFDLATLTSRRAELEAESQNPDFWSNPKRAQAASKELAAIKGRLEPYERLSAAYNDILEFSQLLGLESDPEAEAELERMTAEFFKDLESVELITLLGGKHDSGDAIVEISAGAGGTEACDWAWMLFRMYTRWAERSGFKLDVLTESPGDVTGYRSVTFRVSGPFAYGKMRSEHGVHRLVRISPFDASARRHTSFAAVSVTPVVEEAEVSIRPEDLKVDTYRSSGAGGQHVNKTESAIRITHLPTGIVVSCQNERSQHQNRASAMTILASRLAELEQHQSEERLRQLRGDLTSADWGSQIRSYVLQPYTLVKDQRTGWETGNTIAVLDGEIDPFMTAYLRSSASQQER